MRDKFGDEVEFLTVYIREAHPVSDEEKATSTNAKAGILVRQPTTLDERRSVADRCRLSLNVQTTMVVDEIDNRVANAYAAAPDRLYVVDRNGRIAYRGGPGPFGFNPSEMEQTLIMMAIENDELARAAVN